MSAFETLTLERDGHVATLTMNRPERMNAFNALMRQELPQAWQQIGDDDDIWVVILTGAGVRAFSAGMDLKEPPQKIDKDKPLPRVKLSALDCDMFKPVITAVNGVCAGGGLAFIADTDICICSESAYFTDARTTAGQVSIQGTLRLARKIPLEAVLRMVMLGKSERVTAQRAYEIGMVSEVVAPDELMPRAKQLAEAIAQCSPNAVFHTKKAIWDSLDHGLHEALDRAWEVVTSFARDYDDAREGARAFVEKRKPAWKFRKP